jgi:hypothetical protein
MHYRAGLLQLWRDPATAAERGVGGIAEGVRLSQIQALRGDTYFVREEVAELIERTAADLPHEAFVAPEALLSSAGFAWFDRPAMGLGVTMQGGTTCYPSGLGWYRLGDNETLAVQVYGDNQQIPCYPMLFLTVGLVPGWNEQGVDYSRGGYGDDARAAVQDDDADAARAITRLVLTFFLFVQQKIAEVAPPTLTRQQRRKAARTGEPVDVPLVVSLRRVEQHKGETGTGSKLTLRVPTRAHWQRYHKGKGGQRVEWVLKDLYWRGPEDAPVKPLVDRVYDVKR